MGGESLQLHRLIQAVVRDRHSEQSDEDQRRAELLVAAAEPDNIGTDPGSWPEWAKLLPHLIFLNPAIGGPELRSAACNALWYLLMLGEYRTALPLADAWHESWLQRQDPDDIDVLRAADQLAVAHSRLGEHAKARRLHEDILGRRRRILGENHPDTLTSAHRLAIDLRQLGEHEAAHQLDQDTYDHQT